MNNLPVSLFEKKNLNNTTYHFHLSQNGMLYDSGNLLMLISATYPEHGYGSHLTYLGSTGIETCML